MNDQRVPLPGSAPKPTNGSSAEPRWSSNADPTQKVSVTITLRRQHSSAAAQMEEQLLSGQGHALSREQAVQATSADPRDMSAVRSFLEEHGLTITQESMESRTLKAEGTVAQMEETFSTRLAVAEGAASHEHVSYSGELSVPQSLAGIITSVIGLDQRPLAHTR